MNILQVKKDLNNLIWNYSVLFFIGILMLFIVIGTFIFHIVENWSLFTSFYFTAVTISTIGYWDITPLTNIGKIVAVIYGFMWAPLFIGFTGLLFQSKFQKMIKSSIHAYHREVKETEKLAEKLEKHNKKQDKEIAEIKEQVDEVIE